MRPQPDSILLLRLHGRARNAIRESAFLSVCVTACRHGTHTSGTIGAQRDGHGVVGVSAEGAQLYHYNFFGPEMQASDDLEVAAWQECISELDRHVSIACTNCTFIQTLHWFENGARVAACDHFHATEIEPYERPACISTPPPHTNTHTHTHRQPPPTCTCTQTPSCDGNARHEARHLHELWQHG